MTLQKKRPTALIGLGLCTLTLAVAGCGGTGQAEPTDSTGKTDNPIIGGVDAKSASLNAIGSLVQVYRYTYYDYSCYDGAGGRVGRDAGSGGSAGKAASGVPSRTGAHLDLVKYDRSAERPTPPPIEIDAAPPQPIGAGGAGGGPGSPGTGGRIVGAGGAPPLPDGGAAGSTIITEGGTAGSAGSTCTDGGVHEYVEYWPFCSGALIGSTAVVTAKHCLQDLDYIGEAAFAVGPDAFNPVAVYPIVDYEWESTVAGNYSSLLSDLGSDVGVAHLGSAVAGVTPLAIGTLQASDVGARFTAVGYGDQNNYETYGTRKAGSLTLRGIGGNYADYAFGGFEGFKIAAKTMPQFEYYDESYLYQIYLELSILPDYQAFLGGMAGDAQPCYGDSGGPMVAMRNGVRTTFGVVTNGLGSDRLICDFGAVFGVFGPATQTFLLNSLLWVDPCAGLTVQGRCEGASAVRCTDRNEGKRRMTRTDCDLIGQTCGIDQAGNAACVDP